MCVYVSVLEVWDTKNSQKVYQQQNDRYAPTLALVRQHALSFREYMIREKFYVPGFDFEMPLCVGSEKVRTRKQKERKKSYRTHTHTHTQWQKFKMTTIEDYIKKYIDQARENPHKLYCIISTYASASKVYINTGKECFSMMDECHRCE